MSFSQKQKSWIAKILSQRVTKEVRENSRKIGSVFCSPKDETVELVIRSFKEGYGRVSSFFGFKNSPL